jgi:hypothetical protein
MLSLAIFRYSLKSVTFICCLSCWQSPVNPFTKQLLPCQGVIASARVVCGADQLSLGEECSRSFHLFRSYKKKKKTRRRKNYPPDTFPVVGKRRAHTKCGSVGPAGGCCWVNWLHGGDIPTVWPVGLCLRWDQPSGHDTFGAGSNVRLTWYWGTFVQKLL